MVLIASIKSIFYICLIQYLKKIYTDSHNLSKFPECDNKESIEIQYLIY